MDKMVYITGFIRAITYFSMQTNIYILSHQFLFLKIIIVTSCLAKKNRTINYTYQSFLKFFAAKLHIKPHKVGFNNGKTHSIWWLATLRSSDISQLAPRKSCFFMSSAQPTPHLDRKDLYEASFDTEPSFEALFWQHARLLPLIICSFTSLCF